MHNLQVFNPAAFGMGEADLNASVLYRMQLSPSLEGAPRYLNSWIDYRLKQKRMALGGNINYQKYGATQAKEILLNYSYAIPITRKLKFSGGLRAGLSNTSVNTGELRAWDQNDPLVNSINYSSTYAKIGFGFHLSSTRFYAGFSSPDFVNGNKNFSVSDKSTFSKATYVAYAGGNIALSDAYKLSPSVITYLASDHTSVMDFSLLLEGSKYFWVGANATTQKQIGALVGAYLGPRLRVGYAYQFSKASDIGKLNTHEINLLYTLDNISK